MIFKWRPIFRAIESALGIGIWAARARTGVMKRWSAWMPMQRTEPLGTMKRWIRIDSQCSKTLIRSVPVYLYGKASTSSLHAHASYRFRDWREPNHMIIYDWSVAVAHSTNPLPRQLLNTCALKSITLHAIFCTFQVAIATVNSKNALHVRSFGCTEAKCTDEDMIHECSKSTNWCLSTTTCGMRCSHRTCNAFFELTVAIATWNDRIVHARWYIWVHKCSEAVVAVDLWNVRPRKINRRWS